MLRRLGAAAGVAAGLGTGTARAGRVPADPRIEFHRQTRRLDADTPSVLVARADLPEGGFVMVHDEPASGGHHASVRFSSNDHGGSGSGADHTGHDHDHDVFGITTYLDPGRYGGVRVPLTEAPAPGPYELVGMLHADDGNETFDDPARDQHYRIDGSDLHVTADVRFIAPTDRSR